MKTLWNKIGSGLKYGSYFLIISFSMGVLYGALAGIPLQTGKIAAILIGVFVTINFIFALLSIVPMLFGIAMQKKWFLTRYFGISSGFMIVFTIYFFILKVISAY